jgi:peptide/nickel transport system substrate-binding protein
MRPHEVAIAARPSAAFRLGTTIMPILLGAAVLGAASIALGQDRDVTIVLQEEPFSVEPCDANTSIIGKVLKQNIVETLVDKDPVDGTLTPRLATSWEQIDPLTWRFHLREGVKFHDGADFDADAVIYAIDRTLDTRIDCEVRIKVFSEIEMTPKAVDSHTLDIATDKPAPILPTMMVPLTIMSPNTPMGEMSRHPIGTGPYTFVNWDPGVEINLKRFDDWWGDQPEVENARYVWRTESAVRAAMVEVGEADLAPNIAAQEATSEETDFSYPNSETTRLRIDVTQPPLDDRRVREALNLVIDRDALRGSVFSKDVEPATQLVMPSINGHNPDLKVWPYDPERARQLLAEAKADGVAVDSLITIIGRTGVYPGSAESLEAIMAMLTDVGFNVELKMLEVAQHVKYLQKPYPLPRSPIIQQDQHDNNSGDAVFTVFYKYHTDGANSVLNDAKLDGVIEQASAAVGEERRALWNEAFRIINDEIIADVPLYHMVGYARVGPRISYEPTSATNSEVQLQTITFN